MIKENWIIVGVFFCLIVTGSIVAMSSKVSSSYDLLFVSKTEYIPGDDGQVIVELRSVLNNSFVVPAICTVSVWYPNKTLFVSGQSTTNSSSGSKYIMFSVPDIVGTYEYQASCLYEGKEYIRSSSFHVSSGFGLLQDDVRQNLQIDSQGVSEVQLGKGAKNSWKFYSPFLTTIYNATCRINSLGDDSLMYFSDNFNRVDDSIVGNDWFEVDNTAMGGGEGSYTSISGNALYSYLGDNVAGGSGGVQWAYVDRNLTFIPGSVWSKVNTLGLSSVPADMWYLKFYFYNSTGDVYGTIKLQSYFYDNWNGFGFNNCGVNSPPPGDDCGNVNACTGTDVCKTYSLNVSAGEEAEKNISENLLDLIGSTFDPFAASYVTVRWAGQSRQSSGTRFKTKIDDLIILAQPSGTEFVDNINDVFGFNWTASRTALSSWRNVEVQCVAVFNNNGQIVAQQVEQYVFISNDDRLRAVTPK